MALKNQLLLPDFLSVNCNTKSMQHIIVTHGLEIYDFVTICIKCSPYGNCDTIQNKCMCEKIPDVTCQICKRELQNGL